MKKLIIAHRGAHDIGKGIRENTKPAFERAIQLGADMVEFDVHKTKDNHLIIHHDNELFYEDDKRTISTLNLHDVMTYATDSGLPIPTLREILDCTRGKIALDIELKKNPGQEKNVVEILLEMLTPEDKYVITSFEESFISILKKKSPSAQVGILTGAKKNNIDCRNCINSCISSEADFWAPRFNVIGPELLQAANECNRKIYVWTVDRKPEIIRFLNHQSVDAIITNAPEIALSTRDIKINNLT